MASTEGDVNFGKEIVFEVDAPAPDSSVCLPSTRRLSAIVMYEECATLWLWAWPELLGWRRRISWMFSPVTGKRPYPGDLWGIDEAGALIVVETKLGDRKDPFQDFVGYESEPKYGQWCDAEALLTRWGNLLKSERKFIETSLPNLSTYLTGTPEQGVVPYSYKRFAVRRWGELYTSAIVPKLLSQQYEVAVRKSLKRLSVEGNASIVYFGVIAVEHPGTAVLSTRGLQHFQELRELAPAEHILLRGTTAKPLTDAVQVRISSWTIPL